MISQDYLIFQALAGFVFLIGLSYIFSDDRKVINWRLVLSAFILQNVLFLMLRYVPFINSGVGMLSTGVVSLLDFAKHGAQFVFGDLVNSDKYGFIFAFVVIPTLIFFGSLVSILYFFGIIQRIITVMAFCLRKTVRLSGVESLVVIADMFLGQAEGPLIIGPYIKSMTRSELACAFIAGLANISGSTLGMYLIFLGNHEPAETIKFANYLVTASFMNAVSAIIFAKILFPETDFSKTSTEKIKVTAHFEGNFIDSVFHGAMTGLKIGATLGAILIAVISIIHMLDGILASLGNLIHINNFIQASTNGAFNDLSLEYILGQIFRVFAFFMGVNWLETINVGSLLGQKVAINEFVAYISLGQMKAHHALSDSAVFVSTFALASFSNFSSIGISLGAFSVLAPTKQAQLSKIGFKALFGAVLAGFMTATVAGFWHNILG